MNYKIEFQYKPIDNKRPYDKVQEEQMISENGDFIPVPNIVDSITLERGIKR